MVYPIKDFSITYWDTLAPKSIIFLAFSTDEEYRLMRSEHLNWCCQILRARYLIAQDIIGFATESGFEGEFRSEDALYFDGRIWNG